jgi:aspartate-semialdehyde dehydrogenase
MEKYNVAVAGALGLVGTTMTQILEEYDFPVNELRLLEHKSMVNAPVKFKDKVYLTQEANEEAFEGIDIALFATNDEISKDLVPQAVKKGAIAIDNSRTFRQDSKVPLVVPEVNGDDLNWHPGIVANPNCTTAACIIAYKVLYDLSPIKRIVASSYQSTSGGAVRGMMELKKQAMDGAAGFEITPPQIFAYQIAYNLIPFIDKFGDQDYTLEEWKMVNESRKMLHDENIAISCTCIRVPTLVCHAVSLNVETERKVTVDEFREACRKQPGLKVMDDVNKLEFPQPVQVTGGDDTHIGRIRKDISNPNALNFFVVSDNVRKGAAQNAVQIAQELVKRGLVEEWKKKHQ